jgi:cytochrome c oxidase accessory protein FixG
MSSTHLLPTPSERVLSTLNADGSRRWLRPRVSPGKFLEARRITAWVLIGIFTTLPFLRIGNAPAVLLDVAKRQFTLFGKTFLPTDTVLLAVLLLGIVVTLFLVTAVLGRVWCGWGCPQTVYLEFLYRPIERWFDGDPGRGGKIGRKATAPRTAAKYAVFFLASVLLANVFLSYFVGVESLEQWMTRSPASHPTSFVIMVMTTGLMFFNFAWFREQTCIVACPYGRLQSVLLDSNSLIVSYDSRRGEPRGRRSRSEKDTSENGGSTSQGRVPSVGDCVDCRLCVETCPTGIDIRDGLRMECVGCAQCIDACDSVMRKLKRPRGLVRYSSQARIAGDPGSFARPRLFAYSAFLLVIFGVFAGLVFHSKATDVTILRGMGVPFTVLSTGEVANPLRLKITNRTREPRIYRVEIAGAEPARLLSSGVSIPLQPTASVTRDLAIAVQSSVFVRGKHQIRLNIIDDNQSVTQVQYELLGPQHNPAQLGSKVPSNARPEY